MGSLLVPELRLWLVVSLNQEVRSTGQVSG